MNAATAPETEALALAAALPSLLELFGTLHCRPDIPNEVYHAG